MKKMVIVALFGLTVSGVAYGQAALTVGKSNAAQWTEKSAHKGKNTWRQLAVTSTDQKSELIVEFFSELGGIGMNVTFFDRPALACHNATLHAIKNTSLLLNGKPLPGEHADGFSVGCAYEKWIEHDVAGSVDANVAIVQALLDAKEGVIHVSSTDGNFDHSYTVNGFRALERGDLDVYRHSKGYQLVKSMQH
jgi:hypothetical protein